jgi:hypothetical protein
MSVEEVLPGLFHWTAIHPHIHSRVSSWWLEQGGTLIDPLAPEVEGVEWFAGRSRPPAAVLLSNRHHYRDAGRFAEAYGCSVYCNREGLHQFGDDRPVEGFAASAAGTALAGGVVAYEVGAICPDETALHLPAQSALLFADGVVRGGEHGAAGALGFVPDELMDDPPQTKRGLLEALARLLEALDFEHVLLAHGGPVIDDGRALLEDLVKTGGRTAFEL